MDRRNFINFVGKSALISSLLNSCAVKEKLPDSRHLVDTPESRAEYLEKILKALCTDLGPHPIGSPEYDKAALIVKKEMEKALPIVELDTFTFERWLLKGEPEFYIGDRRMETYPGHGTAGTPEGGITGILKEIDDEGGVPYGVIESSSGEIKAYVTVSRHEYAVPLPYYSFKKNVKSLPTFNIGQNDEYIIKEAVEKGTPVRLHAEVEFIPDTPTSNVVGILPGESEEDVVFLAHLDTVYNTMGANDNTASLIMMLMLAHAFSGIHHKKTLTFVATTGEEYDKLGAINYVEMRRKEGTLTNIKWVFNYDSITWGPNIKIFSEDEELCTLFRTIDQELNIDGTPELIESDGFQLDARPFRETGARAVYFNSGGYDNGNVWHRPEDVPESVPFDCVEICFLLCEEFIKRVQDM